ncbi:MAG: flagellar export chaperone FliS [Rhodothermales bacterium]
MNATLRMRQYQQQAISTASPEQIILKLYDLGIAACRRDDRSKLRSVLVELLSSLNFEEGGEIAQRLADLYAYCMEKSAAGDLREVEELLSGLRDAWKGVLARKAA